MAAKFKALFLKFKENKKWQIAGVCVLIAVLLLLYFVSLPGDKTSKEPETSLTTAADYRAETENKLCDVVSMIKGVGKVKAMILFESTPEIIIAYISSISGNGETQSPQILSQQGSQLPLVLKTVYPKALGAVVVAEGASNVKIKMQIIEAVITVLGITSDKVNVFAM